MIDELKESLIDNPTGFAIGLLSVGAIAIGIFMAISKGGLKPNAAQQQLEEQAVSQMLNSKSIEIANARFDAGCEGVFYLSPGTNTYQPLTEGVGVLSGAYWQRWAKAKVKPLPGLTDYLPAKTMVCDAYGNIGILAKYPNSPAVVSELLNTPDVTRIKKMMSRYPSAVRPQVGS